MPSNFELLSAQAVILIALDMALVYLLIRELYLRMRLQRLGVATQAIILEKSVIHYRGSAYHVVYRFTHHDQTYTKEKVLVSKAVYMNLVEGNTVQIQYLPFAPTISKLWGEYDDGEYLLRLLIGAAIGSFFAVGFGVFVLSLP